MTNKNIQSSRAEWSEFSQQIQGDVNETLTDLSLEIQAINVQLSLARRNNPEDVNRIAVDAVMYLDEKWGYHSDVFMVTGSWHYPTTVSIHDNVILCEYEKTEAFQAAQSNGFMVKSIEVNSEEESRVGLSFIVGSRQISTPSFQGNIDVLAFAEPNEVSLQFMRPGSQEVVSSSLEEVAKAMGVADALLLAYINHQGTTFFQQSAKRQSAFLQEVIDTVERVLPAPDSMDRLQLVNAQTPHVYFKDLATGEVMSAMNAANEPKYSISGDILEVTLIDIIKNGYGKAYRSPDEMAAPVTGLCLIVRPNQVNFDMEPYGNPDIIVPIRAIKNPTITLV